MTTGMISSSPTGLLPSAPTVNFGPRTVYVALFCVCVDVPQCPIMYERIGLVSPKIVDYIPLRTLFLWHVYCIELMERQNEKYEEPPWPLLIL